jgi:hypothetical protein
MEADDPQSEQSARAKRRIREEGTGKEEEKKRRKRGSRAKSRPGAGVCPPQTKISFSMFLQPTSTTLVGWSVAVMNWGGRAAAFSTSTTVLHAPTFGCITS